MFSVRHQVQVNVKHAGVYAGNFPEIHVCDTFPFRYLPAVGEDSDLRADRFIKIPVQRLFSMVRILQNIRFQVPGRDPRRQSHLPLTFQIRSEQNRPLPVPDHGGCACVIHVQRRIFSHVKRQRHRSVLPHGEHIPVRIVADFDAGICGVLKRSDHMFCRILAEADIQFPDPRRFIRLLQSVQMVMMGMRVEQPVNLFYS